MNRPDGAVSESPTTAHDPLCDYRPEVITDHHSFIEGKPCRCHFISVVRSDERAKAARRAAEVWDEYHIPGIDSPNLANRMITTITDPRPQDIQ